MVVITPLQKQYQLVDNFTFILNHTTVTIPKGFKTDGASIPRMLHTIIGQTPFNPNIIIPSMIHDYLYTTGICTRKEADVNLLNMLILNDLKITGYFMYLAVRLFGFNHFKGDK